MTVRTSTLSPSTTEAIAILWTCLHLVAHLSQKTKGKGYSICAVADCWRSPGYAARCACQRCRACSGLLHLGRLISRCFLDRIPGTQFLRHHALSPRKSSQIICRFGIIFGLFGVFVGLLAHLGHLDLHFRPSCPKSWPFFPHLGPTWRQLGPTMPHLGPNLAQTWSHLAPKLSNIGAKSLLYPLSEPTFLLSPRCSQNIQKV